MTEPRRIVFSAERAGVEIKKLEGWITFEEVAEMWGMSRPGVSYVVFNSGRINISRDVRSITTKGIMLMRESTAKEMKKRRDADERMKAESRGEKP